MQIKRFTTTSTTTTTTQLISESYNNSYYRVKITPRGGVTIFGVKITLKRSYFFLCRVKLTPSSGVLLSELF